MGCGASNQAGGAAAPQPKEDGGENSFGADLKKFLVKVVKEPEYAKNLPEELAKVDDPQNQVEKLLKMLLSVVETAKQVATPRNDMPEFIVGCLACFLYHLASKHSPPEKSVELTVLKEGGYDIDCKWADAVYEKDQLQDPTGALLEHMAREPLPRKLSAEDIIFFKPDSELGKPAHAVVLDRERELILVVVRGTQGWKDMITDVAGNPREFFDGYAHEFVALAANWIFTQHREKLLALKAANPTYAVRTTGHSLGGGVSGTLALIMHRDLEFANAVYAGVPIPGKKSKGSYLITSVGFGSAAVLSKELVEEVHPYVTTVVHDSDLVPRLSLSNISNFINFADALWDTFSGIKDDIVKLMHGQKPDGYDFKKVMGMLRKAASDPGGLIKDMLEEKMEAAGPAADEAASQDEKRLYSPGRLMYLAKPEKGSRTIIIAKGSMASDTTKMLLKGSMMDDHSCTAYFHVMCTGTVYVK